MTSPSSLTVQQSLKKLLDKYAVSSPSDYTLLTDKANANPHQLQLASGEQLIQSNSVSSNLIPLFPWREERRFQELLQLQANQTMGEISLMRFRCFSPKNTETLSQLLYREFDLCEWLGGSATKSIYVSQTENKVANLILRLQNGIVASIEASNQLPQREIRQDRHEIITRRGVACDRVVDTQVSQHSIYLFGSNETECHTDTDAELYGQPPEAVSLIRAAFRYFSSPSQADILTQRHQHLCQLLQAAERSGSQHQKINV